MNYPHSNTLTFEQYHHAIAEFRRHFHSDEAKPKYDSYGSKHKGCMRYEHFAFYALLRNKPIDIVTHDTTSLRFKELVESLKFQTEKWRGHYISSISKLFALTPDQVCRIIFNSNL